MTSKFLGQKSVPVEQTPYANYTPVDWAMEFVERYGQIDGEHHKAWVIDQTARLLKGTPVLVRLASWEDGTTEWRFRLDEPSSEYMQWVVAMRRGDAKEGEEDEYGYDEGNLAQAFRAAVINYDEGIAP